MLTNGSRPRATRLLARDVERIILRRIAEGAYQVGERLPSCERFGREIGANKNTVSKAYRSLAEGGYVSTAVGRGTFVSKRPAARAADNFRDDIGWLLTLLIEQAYTASISIDELERLVSSEIRARYALSAVRVAFVECNLAEASKFSRELAEELGVRVEPVLLSDLLGDVAGIAMQFDVIAVALSHLVDVQARLCEVSDAQCELAPLLEFPDPESLAEVARLTPGTRLGIITETPEALSALTGLVSAFNPAVDVTSALAHRQEERELVASHSEVLLVTEAAHLHLGRTVGGKKPVIDAEFKLDRRSVEALAQRVSERRRSASLA